MIAVVETDAGTIATASGNVISAEISCRNFAALYWSGILARRWRGINKLRPKKFPEIDRYRFMKFADPIIGSKTMASITDEDIDRVIVNMPRSLRSGTRRNVVSLLSRLFSLAIYPCRLRTTNPVRSYHRPANDPEKLFAWITPSEFSALMRCARVPIERRVAIAISIFTALRRSSLLALRWKDLDLREGMLTTLISKSGYPICFALDDALVALLRSWRRTCGHGADDDRVVLVNGSEQRMAETLRRDLEKAGVERERLFERGAQLSPIRWHDLRASAITLWRRQGKDWFWISQRSGHLNESMTRRYERAARTLEDLRIDPFPPLVIPELIAAAPSCRMVLPACSVSCGGV